MEDPGQIGQMVCYKSNQFFAFNKPPGLAVQHKDQVDLYTLACAFAKRTLHIIHRIDQPVSGVVLFARNPRAAASISKQFQNGSIEKTYFAITEQKPEANEQTLDQYLVKNNRSNKSFVSEEPSGEAKRVTLSYTFLTSSDRYHLLKIHTHTGRHHQIRAQLSSIGCPIKGDVKYGARRKNKDRSIHLHAASLQFEHPITGETIEIHTDPPEEVLWNFFLPYMKK